MRKALQYLVLMFAVIGILDASYLTYEHYSDTIPPCSIAAFADCGKVLKSEYAMVGPLPVSLLGVAFYSTLTGLLIIRLVTEKDLGLKDMIWNVLEKYVKKHWYSLESVLFSLQMVMTTMGFLFSVYFVYLQLNVIKAICLYCMLSAFLSTAAFATTLVEWARVRKAR